MCNTHNTIGSLSTLKSHLEKNNIHDFKSLKEVIDFQKSYTILRDQLISYHENIIEQEKNILSIDLPILKTKIETKGLLEIARLTNEIDTLKQQLYISSNKPSINFFKKIASTLRYWNYKKEIKRKEGAFDVKVKMSISKLVEDYQAKNERHQFITSHFKEAVNLSAQYPLLELDRKKATIDEVNNFIYGALGEQKVVKVLEKLSDEYFLVNDFSVSFSTPIYNRNENDYIKSVQIDHILVGPAGVFLIETKNWSEKSLENLSLRSPVEQIKRANFVLFYLLNSEMSNYHLRLDIHHWGDKKVPIKNLIVFTNTRPKEEFKYVKVLTVNELLGYVNYFKPIFSNTETKNIANMILRINE